MDTTDDPAAAFRRLLDIVARLRGPGGCPWDREQSPASLRGDLIEETYECVEAIDEGDPDHTAEELGDLFLLVTMLSYMHQEEGAFSVAGVLDRVSEKLVRRHPHVFGELKVKDSAEVLDNWAKIKVEKEGRRPKDSILDGVSRGLPPLDRAWKLQKKAAKAGFDWPDLRGVIAKVEEELAELSEAAGVPGAAAGSGGAAVNGAAGKGGVVDTADDGAAGKGGVVDTADDGAAASAVEEELGDLLFSAVNLCRFLGVEPSVALQKTNVKFTRRFQYMEKRMRETGREMKKENLAVMDGFWEEAKEPERRAGGPCVRPGGA
ncbi:MAG: nucleoside triphosphate pyrophosphohydrolase [Treponema sp.]|jgi:tetrapyrrole methylase family protein/MazG family protein|nr:nucleoside triphosphate pyrophosphohydrolase [Treponema sp.]